MRHWAAASLALAAALSACTDSPAPTVSAPLPRAIIVTPNACDETLGATVQTQIERLFAGDTLAIATERWGEITGVCGVDMTEARSKMLEYVQFTIDALTQETVVPPTAGTAADSVLTNWDHAFAYVGYASPNLPASVLGPDGAAGVITNASVDRELAAAEAAITVPVQGSLGDQRGHLFAIYPLATGCLTGTNLQQSGPCFEFASFPAVSPAFVPKVKVGICQPVNEQDQLSGNAPALGHLTGGVVRIPQKQVYPTFCEHLDEVAQGSWKGGVSGVTTKLAYLLKKAVGVKPLYAVHGGLGGLGGGLSPFGAVDLAIFQASLNNQIVGGPPAAEAGTWSLFVTPPGSIRIEPKLGLYNDTLIVLRQGGGNCTTCGGLRLTAQLFAASTGGADVGSYDVSWISVQDKPAVKGAPFVLRSTDSLEIARVSYVTTKTSKTGIQYNGFEVGTWKKQVAQTFRVRVNLDNKTTSLYIDGIFKGTKSFVNSSASNLGKLSAEFSGIDSGVIGWADIRVVRAEDLD